MSKIYIVWVHWYELDYDEDEWIDAIYTDEKLAKEHVRRVKNHWENTKGNAVGTFGEMTLEYSDSCVWIGNDFEHETVYYEEKEILDTLKISDVITAEEGKNE